MYSKNIKSTCEKRGRSTGNLRYSYKRHLREKFIELLLLLAAFFFSCNYLFYCFHADKRIDHIFSACFNLGISYRETMDTII